MDSPTLTPPGSPTRISAPGGCEQCSNLMTLPMEIVWAKRLQAWHHAFHAPCDKCPLPGQEASLCSICNHLRLPHLLFCFPYGESFRVRVGSWEDLRERCEAGCQQCRLFHLASQACAESYRTSTTVNLTTCTVELTVRPPYASTPFPGQVGLDLVDYTGQQFTHPEAVHVYLKDNSLNPPGKSILNDASYFVAPRADWKRVRNLLNQCHKTHEQCHDIAAQHEHRNFPEDFRLIDVKARRLIKPTRKCKFVALSYVWGPNPDQSKLTAFMSNVHQLEEDGGLAPGKVATTIEEAMFACEQLNESYLWADRLCIVQDDLVSKQVQIDAMRDIYALADFVMVVVSGSNVDEHIPGVLVSRPCATEILSLGGYQAMNTFPRLWQLQGQSVWGSRSWTYQEAALSNRKLYLTAVQYIFECQNGHVYEDNAMNDEPWKSVDVPFGMDYLDQLPLVFNPKDPFYNYQDHVSKFNVRALTHITDFYDAFNGITSGLYGSPDSCWYGLPKKHFDQAMLWRPLVTESRLPRPDQQRFSTKILLPSWSWSSLECKIMNDSYSWGKFCGPLTDWMSIGADGDMSRMETTEPSEPYRDKHNLEEDPLYHKEPPNWQLMLGLAIAEGCIYLGPSVEAHFWNKTQFVDSAKTLGQRWPTYHDFLSESFCPERWKHSSVPRGATVLAANVQVATLEIAHHHPHRSFGQPCPRFDAYLEIRHEGICIGMVQFDIADSFLAKDVNGFEFAGLSVSTCPWQPGIRCLNPDVADININNTVSPAIHPEERKEMKRNVLEDFRRLQRTYTDSNDTLLLPIPIVNVLMIEQEDGFATRQGLGWVFLRHWGQVERKHQTVFFK